MTDNDIKIKIIIRKEDFNNLREPWNSLLSTVENGNIFLSWEWLYCWWNYFGNQNLLNILLAYDSKEELVGIAPLYLCSKRLKWGGKIKVLSFLGSDIVASDYLDFIIGNESVCIELMHYLRENKKEWGLIELKDISPESVNLRFIKDHAAKMGYVLHVEKKEVCPFIKLPTLWNDYRNGLQKKKIKRLEGYINALEKGQKMKFCRGLLNNSLEETMNIFVTLHIKRMQSLGKNTRFLDPQFMGFHHEIARRFFEKGWLTFYRLEIEGKIVSILYCFEYNDILYFYNAGFDTEWSKYRVGLALFYFAIKDCIDRGLKSFFFLRGGEDYKYFWTKDEHHTYLVHLTRKGLKRCLVTINYYLEGIFK